MRLWLFINIVIAFFSSMLSAQIIELPEGVGTINDPYKIQTLGNLVWLSSTDSIWDDSSYFVQTADIDLSETRNWNIVGGDTLGFFPIGSDSIRFTGIYCGKGYSLKNIYINRPDTNDVGLFGCIDHSHVDSVVVENVSITGKRRVGFIGFIGYSSTVSNITVSGSISATASSAGGVGGFLYDSSMVFNSHNVASIKTGSNGGGIVGLVVDATKIVACTNSGEINGDNGCGGIAGVVSNNSGIDRFNLIGECLNSGNVKGRSFIGGLIGQSGNAKIENCYSIASIIGNSFYGGLIGNSSGDSICTSYSSGYVPKDTNFVVMGGGFIGYSNSDFILNCIYDSNASAQPDGIGLNSDSLHIIGLSTEQMKTRTSYPEWNFDSIWHISPTYNNGYPALRSAPNKTYVTFNSVSRIMKHQVDVSGLVMNYDTSMIKSCGFFYSDNHRTPNGDDVVALVDIKTVPLLSAQITNLADTTVYYIRPFAVINSDTVFGSVKSFKTVPWEGDGEVSNPYQIDTFEDLVYLSGEDAQWHSSFIQTDNIDASPSRNMVSLAGDTVGFSPIGSYDFTHFTGNYNGKGKTISSLFIDNDSLANIGLFGYVIGSSIDSVVMKDVSIHGANCCGAVVAFAHTSSIISNCSVTGEVSSDGRDVGGVVGFLFDNSSLRNCFSSVNVSGEEYVGGIVGFIFTNSLMEDCVAIGDISASQYGAGGVVGFSHYSTKVLRCFSNGSVTAKFGAGGVVGQMHDTYVADCYSCSYVYAESNVGGILGEMHNSTVKNCYSSGFVEGIKFIGGAIGVNYPLSTFDNSFYNSDFPGIESFLGYNVGNNSISSKTVTSSQLQEETTFPTWDFSTVWSIDDSVNWGFPHLAHGTNGLMKLYTAKHFSENMDSITLYSSVIFPDAPIVSHGFFVSSSDSSDLFGDTLFTLPDTLKTMIFKKQITGLKSGVTYMARSFAATNNDTLWGNEVSFTTALWKGLGTDENPYEISSFDDLVFLSEHKEFFTKSFKQVANIDASASQSMNGGKGMLPIGNTPLFAFSGTYNGAGNSIKNISIYNPSNMYAGLFGIIDNAEICNLAVINIAVLSRTYCGGLVGFTTYSSIYNCYVTGSVKGKNNIGGLVGCNRATLIKDCYSTAFVDAENISGGFAGVNVLGGTIENCYSIGIVRGNASDVGAFIGRNVGDTNIVKNCYWNKETSLQGIGCKGLALSTEKMITLPQISNYYYVGWDFSTVWDIVDGKSYPVLRGFNEVAPFAFSDTVYVSSVLKNELIANDIGYKTENDELVYKILECTSNNGTMTDIGYVFDDYTYGYSDTLLYCVGKVLTHGDTLWGGLAKSVVIHNTIPTLTKAKTETITKDSLLEISIKMTDAKDSDGHRLTLLVENSDTNGVLTSYTMTPDSGFIGTLHVQVAVTDGIDTSGYVTMDINVVGKSSIISTTPFVAKGYTLKIAPTPVEDKSVVIFTSKETGKARFRIYSLEQRVIAHREIDVVKERELFITFQEIENLSEGVYYICMEVNGVARAVSRIVKIK